MTPRHFIPLSLALSTVLSAAVYAAPPSPIPAIGAARPLKLPAVFQKTLPNGLRLIVLEDHRQPAVWIKLAMPAGAIRDLRDKAGLSSMTAGLLDQGTATRTQEQIAAAVDSFGASLDASSDSDFLSVSASCLTPHLPAIFELLADITLHPAFAPEEVDRARTQTLSAIRSNLAQPATLATQAAARLVYGSHPYGNIASGTPETLAKITPDDLKTFHDTYFAPNGATLFFAGDITPKRAESLASAAFGAWAAKEMPPLPPPPSAPAATTDGKPRVTIIDRPGSAQTEVRIAAPAAGYSDPSRVAASVATAVLGVGQFGGRLTVEIRVKRGLTYGAASTFARNEQAGEFIVNTFTKNASTGEVVHIALDELSKLGKTPPSAQELADRKRFILGSFAVSVASPSSLLGRLETYTLLGGGPDDLTKFTPRVEAVTPQQVSEILGGIPLAQTQVVLVGDAKAISDQVKDIGPVTVISQDNLDLLSPTLTKPQPPPTAAELSEGKALLDAAVAAHGGETFLAIKSLKATGAGELAPPGMGISLPVDSLTLTTAVPDRVLLRMSVGAMGEIILGAPGGGKPGWVSVGGGVQDQPFSGAFGDPTAVLRLAVGMGFPARPVTDTVLPSLDGKPLQAVAVTGPSGTVYILSIDSETHLLRRVEVMGTKTGAIVHLGAYQVVGGVQLPGQIMLLVNGQQVLSMTLKGYTLNAPVSDAVFEKPKE